MLQSKKCHMCLLLNSVCSTSDLTAEIGQVEIGEVEFDSLVVRLAVRYEDQ